MKSKLLSLFAFSLCFFQGTQAQITVNMGALAPIGDLVKQVTDSFPAPSIVPGAAGTNQTWNFSALQNKKTDSLIFNVPGWTPYSATYPTSNVAVAQNGSKGFSYLLNNSTGLYLVGAVGTLPDPAKHVVKEMITPHSQLMQWTAAYLGTFTDNYVTTAKSPYNANASYDSLMIRYVTTSTVTYDAWGAMTTPLGTFQTLRSFRHQYDTDSIWVHLVSPPMWVLGVHTVDTVDTYNWWTNSSAQGYPLVTIKKNPNSGKITSVQWLPSAPTNSGVDELGFAPDFAVFPNPANDYINVRLQDNETATVSMLDMSGRIVRDRELIKDQLGRINTEGLGSGLYFLVVTGKNGQQSTHKISIVR